MGAKGKKQIIGHKYYFGQHLILSSNPLSILELKFQDKTAWRGATQGNEPITVSRPKLFGGESREGGVSGNINVQVGKKGQPVNGYLKKHMGLGERTPAFRHMTSLVFRHFYHGNNYYPKSPKIKASDAHCSVAWYPQKGRIAHNSKVSGAEIYFGIDASGSMDGTRLANARAAVAAALRSLKGRKGKPNSVRVHFALGAGTGGTSRYNCTDADYEELAVYAETHALPYYSQFYMSYAATNMETFFSNKTSSTPTPPIPFDSFLWDLVKPEPAPAPSGRRIAIVIADGDIPDLAASKLILDDISRLELYCMGIDAPGGTAALEELDNTPGDALPVVDADDFLALENAVQYPFASWIDANPAHILYDALTATVDNKSENTHLIGDSFVTAADTLFAEGFGLSFFWRNAKDLNKLRTKIEEHIDAAVFVSRATGKWEIKLIRNDYVVDDLPVLDVLTWKNDLAREVAAALPNKLVVTYRKTSNGETRALTISDPASIAATNTVRGTKLDFDGVYRPGLAARIAKRELRGRSQPKWSGTVVVGSLPADFDLGSVFILSNPDLGITSPIVCRAVEIDYSLETSRNISVKFMEDKFSLGEEIDIDVDEEDEEDETPALPVTVAAIEETPYYQLVLTEGQDTVDDLLADEPLAGRLTMSSVVPAELHSTVEHATGTGAEFTPGATVSFTPGYPIRDDLAAAADADTVVIVAEELDIENVTLGSLAVLGDELVRVDSVVSVDDVHTFTIGRGCLDTTPQAHNAAEVLIFTGDFFTSPDTTYLSTETVYVKPITSTPDDTLDLSESIPFEVTFNARAIRPYPVGQLKVEGSYAPTTILTDPVTLTWAHRDRTFQTTANVEDHTAASIGPEAGVSYHAIFSVVDMKADYFAATNIFEQIDFFADDTRRTFSTTAVSPATGTTHDVSWTESDLFARADYFDPSDYFEGCFTDNTLAVEFAVRTDRAGYENWQTPAVLGKVLLPPVNLIARSL